MDLVKQFLLLSEKLYSFLEKAPEDKEDKRDDYIAHIDKLLTARGQTVDKLQAMPENPVIGHEYEVQLRELDKAIIKRLESFKRDIAEDMKQLQTTKKSEQQYHNPYGAFYNRDGTYYDKRK
ncbi:flagellar protein FliT [Kurthia huakuii]|uniref:flagellar protein FliT n=1 Tax=Kurthia huakuii TaxID=1421019 RepID=UPI000497B3B1|nr:flagellar protein FliT [Kurthia huakuii]MBM7700756.1 flagellar protein FliT [Kurthia huakuii]